MDNKTSSIVDLESKIILLLNKLKENHLDLRTLKEENTSLSVQNKELEKEL